MIDAQQIEQFRRTTPAERWEVWAELSELGMALWDSNLTSDQIEARWAVWRREHDFSDANMLRAFREADGASRRTCAELRRGSSISSNARASRTR